MPFRYPFEVETSNRLRQKDHRGEEVNKADLLKQAISNFEQAIELDATYTTAYINRAAALSMLGRTGTAKETIDELENVLHQTNEQLPSNARMIRGIVLIEAGRMDEGTAELERSTGARDLAYNREVARVHAQLNKQSLMETEQTLTMLAKRYDRPVDEQPLTPESYCGVTRLPFASTLPFTERLAIPEPGLVRIQSVRTADGALYRIVLAAISYDFVCSRSGSTVQSERGIRSGDSVQLLTHGYGEPNRVIPAANGLSYFCYDAAHFFVAVQQGVVINWFIYTAR